MHSDSAENKLLNGYILTRQWIETGQGMQLIFWLASPVGPIRYHLVSQEAVCFIPTAELSHAKKVLGSSQSWRCNVTQLRSFRNEPVTALYFKSQRRLYNVREQFKAKQIRVFESDIKPVDRYLMERFITGPVQISGRLSKLTKYSSLVEARLQPIEYFPSLRAISIDIETDYQASRLYSIGLYSDEVATVYMVGSALPSSLALEKDCKLELIQLGSEAEVIGAFLNHIREFDPDILIGWNIVNFDLRCLQKFCDRLNLVFKLGRNDENIIWRKAAQGNDRFYALVPGRVILDGIELMRTATYSFENFSLEHVSRQLLHRGKLVDDVDERGKEITDLFENNKPGLARYNLEDCRLVWDIFEKENLIAFAIERSSLTGLELDRYGGSVAAFDYLYLPRLHRKGFVAPALDQLESRGVSPGGYVMDSIPGIYDNVIVLDFKSLYPSIIRTFHIDPLGLIKGLEETDAIPGFDGGRFSREEALLPELIEKLWTARDQAKANSNPVLSQAIKLMMNSFYGVLGTLGCRFFDTRLVSSITKRGHEIMIASRDFIEQRDYQVIYGDTDSVFVLLGPECEGQVSEIGTKLAADLNLWWREQLAQSPGVNSYLEIEFETHYSKFLMPTVRGSDAGSKKRYAGLVRTGTGRDDYGLIFKGLESVRSDWSQLARHFQQVLYERVFLDQPYEEYVKEVVRDLLDEKFEDELVLRKRLRRKLVDYVKNVPPHVQAARKAEAIRAESGLPTLYDSGGWIEYLITVNGPEPRQYRQSPIDFNFYIEKQLAPIADSILVFKSSLMTELLNRQIGLF